MAAWVKDYEARDPDAWIVECDPAEADRIARLREAAFRRNPAGQDRTRKFISDSLHINRVGAMGELGVSKRFGVPMPDVVDGGGDGGVDFRVTFPRRVVTMDVKTREQLPTHYLMVPEDKINNGSAEILILCQQLDERRIRLLGWECKSILALEPPRDVGYKRLTYCRPVGELRPMFQLDYLLKLRQS
jgi:hypothetical protein